MKTAASKTTKEATVMSQAVARENPNPTKILALMAPFVNIYSVIARNYGEETETLYAQVFLTGDGSGECDRELMSLVNFAPDFNREDEDVELLINTEVPSPASTRESPNGGSARFCASPLLRDKQG